MMFLKFCFTYIIVYAHSLYRPPWAEPREINKIMIPNKFLGLCASEKLYWVHQRNVLFVNSMDQSSLDYCNSVIFLKMISLFRAFMSFI